MIDFLIRQKVRPPVLRRAVPAGIAASSAYLVAMAVDMRLTGNQYDDLVLWGGFTFSDKRRQRIAGAISHFTIGTALACVYDAMLPRMPHLPAPVRGVLFAQLENAVLYPGVPLLNALHPAVRSGDLPSLLTWEYAWLEALRHVAYGLVLGMLDVER